MGLSRRQLISRLAAGGGYGAAFSGMQALGLLSATPAQAADDLPPSLGRGRSVTVLGAGIAGLVSAYRLEQAGFRVSVIEARDRVGGRNWTIRDGARIELVGEVDQTARLSEGLYFNAGPARIPSHHQGVLGYCKALGVPLEIEVNSSRSALLQSDAAFQGRPIQQRQAVNDIRGQISELLAKATRRGALDAELNAEDRERLIAFLRPYGDLGPDLSYGGSERSGYLTPPGAAEQAGIKRTPLALSELLKGETTPNILFEDNILMQATMFQPVGGMDRIPVALAKTLRGPLRLNAEVLKISQSASSARVVWRDRRTGTEHEITSDYLVVTLPLNLLAGLDTGFDAPFKTAIAGAVYDRSAKVAFEAPRFWEAEQIYGGLSFPGGGTGAVWYPSDGVHTPRGVLVGAYVAGAPAQAFQAKPLAGQIAAARAAVERLHPGHGGDLIRPIVVDWNKVPFNRGPWLHWESDGNDPAAYRLLNQPQGRIHLTGAHLSHLPSWQEGAVASAHRTVGLIAEQTREFDLRRSSQG
ncbi:FAD-dependent oxidoreductase [Phenylobacterium sp. Root700]|uniref:flavin monoamine oxidase family protein n=1 Tax=Phenylobacterium sp. Root700 TaxID=1736591 RepID=UPI0006FFBF3E|nr:FAD-dependent oxidoreductase [Phenylobacterium sp. Root700]KRB49442.1 hypothetical protein ASE02_16615 [Phenylobacterium sp. Root700]